MILVTKSIGLRLFILSLFFFFLQACHKNNTAIAIYPEHKNITVSYFWIGEEGNKDNKNIPNSQSVWDDKWKEHYGGIDTPDTRNGYEPINFIPKENPFYFALPYNDFKSISGKRKQNATKDVYWANTKEWGKRESMCKNKWIKITKGTKVCYAQWEDAGPFGENDWRYVFGDNLPKNKHNNHAGLDVSPAVRTYLNLSDLDKVNWQFIAFENVPSGDWTKTITVSQIYW